MSKQSLISSLIKGDGSPIDIKQIQKLCCSFKIDFGPPEDRAIAWLILADVYPLNPNKWNEINQKKKNEYAAYVKGINLEDYEKRIYKNSTESMSFGLSDDSMMSLIHRDVVRTSHHIVLLPFPKTDVEVSSIFDFLNPYQEQMRRIERLLYIYAVLNSTTSYLQGFNELITVIYFVLSSAVQYFDNDFLLMESLVFFAFQNLMSSTKLIDLSTMNDEVFIQNCMNDFMKTLQRHLPKSYTILKNLKIRPIDFCYKWLILLFSQNYLLPDLLPIWDCLWAHFSDLISFANYIAVGQIESIKDQLNENDFSKTISAVQNLNVKNVQKLLQWANGCWEKDHK